MPENQMTYMLELPADKIAELTKAMHEAGIPFDPRDNLVEIGHLPDDAIYLSGAAAHNLVTDINEFINLNGWTPELPEYSTDWSPEQTWALLQFASEHMAWDGNSIEALLPNDTQDEWHLINDN